MSSRSQQQQLDVVWPGALAVLDDGSRHQISRHQINEPPFPEERGGHLSHNACGSRTGKRHASKKRKRIKRRFRRLPAREALAHTINQFAARANLSRPTLYRMMKDGELRFIRVRNHRLIPVSEYSRLGLEDSPTAAGEAAK